MAPRAPRRRLAGLVAGAVAATVMLSSQDAFIQAASPAATDMSRRVVLGSAVPVLLGAAQAAEAIPRVTDRGVYINRRKLELVPIFKQGMDYLKKGVAKKHDYTASVGTIDDILLENSQRIKNEIKDVSDRHADDIALLTQKPADFHESVLVRRRFRRLAKGRSR